MSKMNDMLSGLRRIVTANDAQGKSNIMIDDAGRLKMTNSTSRSSAGSGLYLRDLTSTLVDFSQNAFTGNND